MQGSFGTIDIGILILYGCVLIGMGIYYKRKCRTADEFMVAGRSIPAWAAGLAVMSTYTSSISYIATPGKAFDSNWHPFIFSLCIIPVAWFVCKYAVPYYRKIKLISVYEFLEDRLGSWARIYGAISFVLFMVGRIAVILYLASLLLNTFVPWGIVPVIIGLGVITIAYTFLGGMEAVIWTDVMQSIVMIVGIIFCAITLTYDIFSQPDYLVQAAFDADKFSLGSAKLSLASQQHLFNRTIWAMIIFGIIENLRSLIADQNCVQKYSSVADERQAKKSIWIGMLIYIPLTAIFLYIGTALFAFYSLGGHQLGEGITKGSQVFPFFIATQLPVGLKGLVVAAILAAAMSTVDSNLNCSATVLLLDFYKRYFNPKIGERQSIMFLRGTTIAWGILGTFFAILMIRAESILDLWWQISGIFGGGVLGVFILGMLRIRLRLWQGLVSIGVSIVVIAWATFMRDSFLSEFGLQIPDSWKWAECNLDVVIIGAVGTAAMMLAALVFGLVNRIRDIRA
ncbi:MAG TPA: sodium:solute symporter [Phycisphaerales bacterium]|nr:sodium:solute symporter [Phycisphaerales bacterium]